VLRERVRHEQRLLERLQTANIRFADAQLERLWAIKSAHELDLSIRQIAAATGVSSSRIHQVLNSEDPTQILSRPPTCEKRPKMGKRNTWPLK